MELAFDTKELRKLCEKEAYADKQLGHEVASKLQARLADIDAASVVTELPSGSPKVMKYAGITCMSLNILNGYIIVFCSNHVDTPILTTGKVDWASVRRIKVLSIQQVG